MRSKMSTEELYGWSAYFTYKSDMEAKAYQDAKKQAQFRKLG